MKLYLYIVFGLFIFGTVSVSGQTQVVAGTAGWHSVTRCHFSFDLPDLLQESTDRTAGSCVTGFNGNNLFVQMDYGYNSAPTDKDKSTRDYRATSMTIGGRKARIITYRSVPVVGGNQQPVDWVTEVYVITAAATRRNPLGKSLLFTITSTDPNNAEAVKRIFTSLRFRP